MFKTYSSSSSLVTTSRWFVTSRLVAPVSVRLVYWLSVNCFTVSPAVQIGNPQRHIGIMEWGLYKCSIVLNLNQTKWSPELFHSETVSRYDYVVPYIDLGDQGHLMLLLSQRISINISLHAHWSYFYKCVDSCFTCSFRVLLGVFQFCAPKAPFLVLELQLQQS